MRLTTSDRWLGLAPTQKWSRNTRSPHRRQARRPMRRTRPRRHRTTTAAKPAAANTSATQADAHEAPDPLQSARRDRQRHLDPTPGNQASGVVRHDQEHRERDTQRGTTHKVSLTRPTHGSPVFAQIAGRSPRSRSSTHAPPPPYPEAMTTAPACPPAIRRSLIGSPAGSIVRPSSPLQPAPRAGRTTGRASRP